MFTLSILAHFWNQNFQKIKKKTSKTSKELFFSRTISTKIDFQFAYFSIWLSNTATPQFFFQLLLSHHAE